MLPHSFRAYNPSGRERHGSENMGGRSHCVCTQEIDGNWGLGHILLYVQSRAPAWKCGMYFGF